MYGRAVVPVDMLGRQLQAQRRARYLKENPDAHFDGPLKSTLHESKSYQYTDETQEPEMYHKWVYPRHLKRLDLSHTKMVDYPMGLPTTLEHLELPFSLNYVAPEIGELVKLQSLKLNSPALTTLPPELSLLTCLKAIDIPYCPRMDNTLKVAYEECLRIPGSGWRRPAHLLEVLKPRLGRVLFIKPKPFFRPIVRKGRRKKPTKPGGGKPDSPSKRRKSQTTLQMERFGSKTGSPPSSPKKGSKPLGGAGGSSGKLGGKKKSMKKKKKAKGDMSKDRDSDEDELTVEQLSYVRDLREWREYNPPPQPPMPKDHLGLPLFDVDTKVDTSNWVIVGTDRKPNRRFVSPYEFLQFTQAKPNKHSIFHIDKKTLKVTVPTSL